LFCPPTHFALAPPLALRAEIGKTINLPGHPMSVIQCYLAMNAIRVIRFVYSFASFPSDWMWCL